jgi:hypothetical protein
MKLNFKRHSFIVYYCWLLFLASSLGACQRASYTFQRSAATTYQVVPPAPLVEREETALLTSPRPRAVGAPRKRARFARLKHRSATQAAMVRVKTPPKSNLANAAMQVAHRGQLRQEPAPGATPLRHRSRGIALLLAILSITYLPLSLHNFYLGYYGRGALAIGLLVVGIYLLAIGFVGFLFGGAPAVLGYVGLLLLAGWTFWQIADIINIISGKLQPKDGEYNARLL